jgi:hypothetical protein
MWQKLDNLRSSKPADKESGQLLRFDLGSGYYVVHNGGSVDAAIGSVLAEEHDGLLVLRSGTGLVMQIGQASVIAVLTAGKDFMLFSGVQQILDGLFDNKLVR